MGIHTYGSNALIGRTVLTCPVFARSDSPNSRPS